MMLNGVTWGSDIGVGSAGVDSTSLEIWEPDMVVGNERGRMTRGVSVDRLTQALH